MAKQGKLLPARKSRPDESLLIRSAQSLGRMIGSLQRELDDATRKLSAGAAGKGRASRPAGNGHAAASSGRRRTKRASKSAAKKKTPRSAARRRARKSARE